VGVTPNQQPTRRWLPESYRRVSGHPRCTDDPPGYRTGLALGTGSVRCPPAALEQAPATDMDQTECLTPGVRCCNCDTHRPIA